MINARYVDGLELRIKELNKKLSDEADAALHLIAENKSLKAERDALAAKLSEIRRVWDACGGWPDTTAEKEELRVAIEGKGV